MANPVLTMEAANLFCGAAPDVGGVTATNHLILSELKLPGFDEQYADHRPGGAPVAIEIDTVFARLQCTFMLLGYTSQVAALIASWSSRNNQFFAYGVLRNRDTGIASQAEAIIGGRLSQADPQNWRRGDPSHWNYSIRGITHYELRINDPNNDGVGADIYYWDFFNNVFQVGGENMNIDTNALLYTGATGAAGVVVPIPA